MAFKLDKQETARRDEIVTDLTNAAAKLEDVVNVYNEAVTALRKPLDDALLAYNEAVEAARGFAQDIASQADSDLSEKSQRWQEGDKGEAAISWKDEWESASFNDVSVEYPDNITIDGVDHADTLDQLPVEAD